ncbi:MAG: hypothetical protein ACLRSW_10035 [Christensenellaceae bacterium]
MVDKLNYPEIVGSAGDDTLLIVCEKQRSGRRGH